MEERLKAVFDTIYNLTPVPKLNYPPPPFHSITPPPPPLLPPLLHLTIPHYKQTP